jgi:hypothetical protein
VTFWDRGSTLADQVGGVGLSVNVAKSSARGMSKVAASFSMFKPVLLQPIHLRFQSIATPIEGAKFRPPDRRQVGQPTTICIGFDMTGPGYPSLTQGSEVDLLAVNPPDSTISTDDDLHYASFI